MCLTVCAPNQSVHLCSMVSLCCLLYTVKILKGERLKIITIIVLKVEHFYNDVMQPKWQINMELNDFRKIICLTNSKVFLKQRSVSLRHE